MKTGTFFSTTNNKLWVPIEDADLTIRIYRAKFTKDSSATVTLGNSPVEKLFFSSVSSSLLDGVGNVFHKVGNLNIKGQLTYYDEQGDALYGEFKNSSGGLTVGTSIVDSSNLDNVATISSIESYDYSAVSFEPHVLDFLKTSLKYTMSTVDKSTGTRSGFVDIHESQTFYLPTEKIIYSRSDEINKLGSAPSTQINVTMFTNSEYVTPVVDLTTTHLIVINNLINNDASGEDGKSGGNALNKYISQTVQLADGQDAEDVKVYLTAHRPPGTDVKVYIKIKSDTDTDKFEEKNWIELVKEAPGSTTFCSTANRLDFKEYTFVPPSSVLTGPAGQIQYSSGTATYNNFKQFAVKIVLLASNQAIVPRVADLRVLAVQM